MPVRRIDRQHVRLGLGHFHRALQKISGRADRCADAQAALLVFRRARIFELFLNVFDGDQPFEVEILVYDQKFFDAMFLQDALGFFERRAHRNGH
jgi:hypothetical protein